MAGAVVAEIQRLPDRTAAAAGAGLQGIGAWLSLPFASSPLPAGRRRAGTWLGYGIWVMLAAKLLGGRGTLHGFFGATGFFAVPHVLDILRRVPVARRHPCGRCLHLGRGDLRHRDRGQPPPVRGPGAGRRLCALVVCC